MSDENRVGELLDNLIIIYHELKQSADEYTVLQDNLAKDTELLQASNKLTAIKSLFEKICNVVGFTLSEMKNNGYTFEVKICRR